MKFGQYLKDHLTPEWKRAYIDYSACKKAIKVVKKRLDQAREGQRDHTAGEGAQEDGDDREASSDLDDEDHGPSKPRRTKTVSSTWSARSPRGTIGSGRTARTPGSALRQVDSRGRSGGSNAVSPQAIPRRPSPPPPLDLGESSYPKSSEIQQAGPDTPRGALGRRAATISDAPAQIIHASSSSSPDEAGDQDNDPDMSDSGRILTSPSKTKMKSATFSPRFHKSPRIFQRSGPTHSPKSSRGNESPQVSGRGGRSIRSLALQSPKAASVVAPTFEDLYKGLEEDERAFFDLLDHELNKVEQFFTARQKEAQDRFKELKDQLTTLGEHRKRYHELYPNGLPGVLLPPQQVQSLSRAANKLHLRIPFTHDADHHVAKTDGEGNSTTPKAVHDKTNGISGDPSGNATAENGRGVALGEFDTYNPERYQHYKRELRAASLDFYRHLERIKNYRILNLTGFRKALKKFEKTTRIHCMDMYTDERISKESFAQGDVVEKLLDQMEKLYSEHFEHGDSKKARDRLRRQTDVQTHHTSVFRAGMMIGLAMPAVIFALVIARKPETKVAIPPRDELLQVYGALFMPVMFGMLFQLNLDAFVSARINYEFVMELTKPTLDYRCFLEIPAFLFLTLSYCCFFSFYRVGASHVAPTTWPAAWLVFVVVFFLNPFNIFRRSSRYWFLRVLFRVATPGYSRVEFIAFFLADELNSLAWSTENVYFIACAYSKHWPGDTFERCPVGKQWPYGVMLCLAPLARLIQCLKRYHDSNIGIHLVNAGKYFSVICQYSLFVLWRSRGSNFHDPVFIVWIFIAAAAATYTSSWDLIVDWSLFRPHSAMLRQERGYSSRHIYYFAMVTNVLVRWEWIWYLPVAGRYVRLRTYFIALAEMLRRWQWNFFRVETEHLGNADAYRVTREIPLPYRRIEHDSEEDEMGPNRASKRPGSLSIRLEALKREILGRGPKGEGDGNGDGHEPQRHVQRDYEAGQRLDPVVSRTRDGDESEV